MCAKSVKLAKQVAKNAFYRTLAKIIGNVSGILIAAILARILGPHEFGVYSLALSVSFLCISLADQGITATSIKYISYYHGKWDLVSLRTSFRYLVKLELTISLFITSLVVVFSGTLSFVFKDPSLRIPLIFAGIIVLFGTAINVVTSLFVGLQRFEYTLLKQILYEIFRWILVVPLSVLFLATGAVAGTCMAYAFTLIILVVIVLNKFRLFIFGDVGNLNKNKLNIFIGFMSLTNISTIILSYTDIIMIGVLLSTTDVGYYRAAVNVIVAVVGLLTVFDVLLSAFSRLSSAELKNVIVKVSKYSIIISFPLAVIIYYLSGEIIYLIYGSQYISSIPVLSVLSFILFPNAFNFIGPLFISRDKPECPAILTVISVILNIVLNYVLILKFGIIGAAVASVISRCLVAVLGIYLLYKYFNTTIFDLVIKSILGSFVMIIILKILPHLEILYYKIILSILLLMIYLVVMFAMRGLTIDDIVYLRKLLSSIFSRKQ